MCIAGAAVMGILLFAGAISSLVVHHRWIMYSIFIGLTLGGVPLLWRMVRPADTTLVVSALAGIAVMAAVALVSPAGNAAQPADTHRYVMYFAGGLAGASAMVLPGISGGYLLLVLGQYVTILSAVAAFKDGLRAAELSLILEPLHVLVPVGIGVLLGIVAVSNLVKMLLRRFERPTLGVLLGLLLGAVIGLWPFQQAVPPVEGVLFRGDAVVLVDGRPVMRTTRRPIDVKDYDTAFFSPSAVQIAGSLAAIAAGFALSMAVARLGSGRKG
jgi:putative membrane protein